MFRDYIVTNLQGRLVWRTLRRKPFLFSTVALLMALGVGVTVFTFVPAYRVLLAPLPFDGSERIFGIRASVFRLVRSSSSAGGQQGRRFISDTEFKDSGAGQKAATAERDQGQTFALVLYPEQLSTAFESVAAYAEGGANLETFEARRAHVTEISPRFFKVFGVAPLLGSDFSGQADDEAIISFALWKSLFSSSAGAIGGSIRLDGHPFRIVGVAPEYMNFPHFTEVWVPLSKAGDSFVGSVLIYEVLGRLRSGVPVSDAATVVARVAQELNPHAKPFDADGRWMVPLREMLGGNSRTPTRLLFASAIAILCLTIFSCAFLLLSIADQHRHETAVRMALGASRLHLLSVWTVPAFLTALSGGFLGVVIGGVAGNRLHLIRLPEDYLTVLPSLSPAVKIFGVVVASLAAAAVALIPAFQIIKEQELSALLARLATLRTSSGRLPGYFLRRVLTGMETAIVIVILLLFLPLLRTLQHTFQIDTGVGHANVLVFRANLPESSYDNPRLGLFVQQLLSALRKIPGVAAAATVNVAPFDRDASEMLLPLLRTGLPSNRGIAVYYRTVSPDYFSVVGIPLIQGRPFTDEDRKDGLPVAILNATAARKLEISPGAMVGFRGSQSSRTVIGIVGDARESNPRSSPVATVYLPMTQAQVSSLSFCVRPYPNFNPSELVPAIRNLVRRLDASLPIYGIDTLQGRLHSIFEASEFAAASLAVASVIAVVICGITIYALTSLFVRLRWRELGIQAALGASTRVLAYQTIRSTLLTVLGGCVAGVIGAQSAIRLIRALLFGVSKFDLISLLESVAVLILMASIALCTHVHRVMTIEPAPLLREQ